MSLFLQNAAKRLGQRLPLGSPAAMAVSPRLDPPDEEPETPECPDCKVKLVNTALGNRAAVWECPDGCGYKIDTEFDPGA